MAVDMIPPQPKKFFAQRFALWLGMISMFMAFAGFTSAYIVRRAQSDWLEFNLPITFYISTAVIVLSSITMIYANHAYKHDQYDRFRNLLTLTFILGLGFAVLQYFGWQAMKDMKVFMGGEDANPAGSFVYIISGWHMLHLAGGLFLMAIALYRSFFVFKDPATSIVKNIEPNKGIRMDLLSTYWHFVDVLWIYLLIFFLINK
ncbi:MAG: cytochrome c oxidase subunit 3 [Saprospiraceae bacterium]|nr:cytochrome c oxidase subunit 3 [Saprospiraceae bacterium]